MSNQTNIDSRRTNDPDLDDAVCAFEEMSPIRRWFNYIATFIFMAYFGYFLFRFLDRVWEWTFQ